MIRRWQQAAGKEKWENWQKDCWTGCIQEGVHFVTGFWEERRYIFAGPVKNVCLILWENQDARAAESLWQAKRQNIVGIVPLMSRAMTEVWDYFYMREL